MCYLSPNETATAIAATAAVVAAASAGFSYLLSRRIYKEIKSDEVVVAGPLHRVGLLEKDRDNPLMRVTIFNKSSRKAFVTSVKVIDQDGQQIPITWSNSISKIGSIENPTGLLGLVNSENIYIRRNDGAEFQQVSVQINHSFSNRGMILEFDPYQGWYQ
tara:strand:- start:152 stop:631 length:480 start_codon:yes stop_codon:yes gene_type:complete